MRPLLLPAATLLTLAAALSSSTVTDLSKPSASGVGRSSQRGGSAALIVARGGDSAPTIVDFDSLSMRANNESCTVQSSLQNALSRR